MLHTKVQISEPNSSGQEDLKVYFIFETKTPAAATFLAKGYHLTKLGKESLGNAIYLISS